MSEAMTCANCDKRTVVERWATQTFLYGSKDPVELKACMPVLRCVSCGEEVTDYRGEQAREAVVAAYLQGLGYGE